jgi:hypothetical protein
MTFNFPSFFAAATSAVIEVEPVLVSCVTFAQFTLVAPLAATEPAEIPTVTKLATVAPATSAVLIFFSAMSTSSLISKPPFWPLGERLSVHGPVWQSPLDGLDLRS